MRSGLCNLWRRPSRRISEQAARINGYSAEIQQGGQRPETYPEAVATHAAGTACRKILLSWTILNPGDVLEDFNTPERAQRPRVF
jgi:hypothetical protein